MRTQPFFACVLIGKTNSVIFPVSPSFATVVTFWGFLHNFYQAVLTIKWRMLVKILTTLPKLVCMRICVCFFCFLYILTNIVLFKCGQQWIPRNFFILVFYSLTSTCRQVLFHCMFVYCVDVYIVSSVLVEVVRDLYVWIW